MSTRSPKYPLARLSPAKDDILIITITRDSVMTCDIAPMQEKLTTLSSTREAAVKWEGTVTFAFEGWDNDPRETAEIPEIRAYFAALTEAWPYWLHFAEKVGDTIPHVLRLLCRGRFERLRPDLIGWQFEGFDDIKRLLSRLYCDQNTLYDRLALPEEINERIAQEVAQLIESVFQ
ncbi:chlororespiratory reduction 6 domain-containing protein [Thiocapsa rosea]|uniref:Uncharacterized protein DUF1817 n=1 Tax=Thiocapsa rosea TaxID=69360 RepID=A0A495UKZ0_9GAMM|nr:chlororespiratory reduction 6 domain-containing protein [Thiocapsa rosea]RKT37952.1 uncharacterized protein DUF1817 [Thiocapsa rosea]